MFVPRLDRGPSWIFSVASGPCRLTPSLSRRPRTFRVLGRYGAPSRGVVLSNNFLPGPSRNSRRQAGIEVTALHAHMLTEMPHHVLHFFAADDAVKLARTLGAALAGTNSAQG